MKKYVIVGLYDGKPLDFSLYSTRQEAVNSNIDLIKTGQYDVLELTELI